MINNNPQWNKKGQKGTLFLLSGDTKSIWLNVTKQEKCISFGGNQFPVGVHNPTQKRIIKLKEVYK